MKTNNRSQFKQIEEILENFGLNQLMMETEDEERLSEDEAWSYYQSLILKESACGKLNTPNAFSKIWLLYPSKFKNVSSRLFSA